MLYVERGLTRIANQQKKHYNKLRRRTNMTKKIAKAIIGYPLALAGFYGVGYLLFIAMKAIIKIL